MMTSIKFIIFLGRQLWKVQIMNPTTFSAEKRKLSEMLWRISTKIVGGVWKIVFISMVASIPTPDDVFWKFRVARDSVLPSFDEWRSVVCEHVAQYLPL